jgi:hypothetical protein
MPGPSLAVLGIQVESGQVVQATRSLEGMTVAGTKAEVATQRLSRRMALAEIAARDMDAAMVKTSRTTQLLSSAFAGFSAIAVVGLIGRETIKNTIEAQNAMAQLEAAVTSTGGAAGRTVAQLDALSMQLQKQTTYSDEAVKGAEAMLLTFDKIRGTEFDRATKAVTDLAARMGGDLQAAAVQVGKALQDPATGLTALRRSGVSFGAAQIEVIKQLYETGRAAEGQRVILAELEHQFGGSAAAARDTLGGAITGLKNSFGDLFEVTKGGSQGTVDAINAITKSLENSGLSMNSFVTNTVIGWNNIATAAQKANNYLSIDLTKGLGNELARVKALNARLEFDNNVEAARLRNPARIGPTVGAPGPLGAVLSAESIAAAKRAAERLEQERLKEEDQRERAEQKYVDDINEIWNKGMSDVVASTQRGFGAVVQSVDDFVSKMLDRMAKEGRSSLGLQIFSDALKGGIAGGAAGFGFGQSLYSSSHGGFGNTARGALGGAGAGALAGAAAGGPVGAAVGALAGLAGGILGVGSASREAAKAMAEAVKQVTLSMAALRASVHGETLEGAIAAVEADRARQAKAIEEAWSGGDANSDRVRWRTQQHKELNALEDERIRQLREEYALAQARAAEDLQVRLLTAQGRDEEARTFALQLAQERERQTLIKSFGESIDPVEQATLSLLDQVQAQEKLKAATDAANGSALNMVDGYKALQSHIFAAMSPRSSIIGAYTPIDSQFRAPSSPAVGGGDLTVNVMTPNGEVLGKTVIRDFARRKRLGDAELGNVLQ